MSWFFRHYDRSSFHAKSGIFPSLVKNDNGTGHHPATTIITRFTAYYNVTASKSIANTTGGAQMFKEEEDGSQRVNVMRTEQLLETKPASVASSCPFCQRMLIDGLAEKNREDVRQLDIAELLWQAVRGSEDGAGADGAGTA